MLLRTVHEKFFFSSSSWRFAQRSYHFAFRFRENALRSELTLNSRKCHGLHGLRLPRALAVLLVVPDRCSQRKTGRAMTV